MVLVAGTSGAGKSTVLREAVDVARAEGSVSGPREVMWSDALLQIILDGLADIVSQIVRDQDVATRVGERLSGAMERLAETKGRELAVAAGREIVSLIRGRLGPEAGNAVADAFKALQEESASSLASRLDRARPETARDIIVGFASEVASLSADRRAVVALDRCERLDEAGARLLADLAEVLPGGVQVWAGVRDDNGVGQFLVQTEASVVEIPPLHAPAIVELLDHRGLAHGDADEILRRTDGTALDVQAYVGLLGRGESGDLDSAEALALDTTQRVATLSPSASAVALRFAALSDPLPQQYLLRFTDGDAEVLNSATAELAAAGLLTAHGPDQWIHERRRESLLTHTSRTVMEPAVTDAAAAVWDYVQAGGDEVWLVELAELASQAPHLADDDEHLAQVLNLPNGALAVLAALIELTEPQSRAVDGQALLNYARSNYPTDDRELEHLEALGEAGIAVVVSNQNAAAAVLRITPLSLAVAMGRVGRTFGRMPIPAIGSAAFESVILPRIKPFLQGQRGVGLPSLASLSYMALGQNVQSAAPGRSTRIEDAPPALITRAAFAGRPLYGTFSFASAHRRDDAIDALDGLDVEFLDDRVTVSTVIAHPMTAVPINRFVRAAERVIGQPLPTMLQDIKKPVDVPLDYAEVAELRVMTARVLRDMSGATLRGAMELDRPLSLHWFAGEGFELEVEVHGGREMAEAHDLLPDATLGQGPYRLFHLASALQLKPGENITRVRRHVFATGRAPTTFDPVLSEIGRRRATAIAFNNAQLPMPVSFNEPLAELIREAFFREMTDARTIAASLPLLGRRDWKVPAVAKYVVLPIEPPNSHWVPGARSTLLWAEIPSASGQDECHVTLVDTEANRVREELLDVPESALEGMPGYDQKRVEVSASAIALGGVSELLGYRREDLDFLASLRERKPGPN